jgi:hypothetical protein
MMNNSILMTALVATLFLSACDKTPVVVNVPAETVPVPGPAGPAGKAGEQGVDGNKGDMGVRGNTGDTGAQGYEGTQGETGQAGETGKTGGTTVIITPPAEPAPAN